MIAADAFRTAMFEKLGAAPREIIGDGKIHRFATGKKRDDAGWYQFFDDEFPAGTFGDWRSRQEFKWRAQETRDLSPADRERLKRTAAEREKRREREYQEAAKAAQARWQKARPADPQHEYLHKKRVGAHGLRQESHLLLVPVTSDGETIISLQTIPGEGKKLFTLGSRTKGGYFTIGEPTDTIIIGEGYATLASLYETTGFHCVVAFTASNLKTVAQKIKAKHPRARIVFAADDDFKVEKERGKNPGIEGAKEAASIVYGVVAVPPFDRNKDGDGPSDWNDYSERYGEDAMTSAFQTAADAAAPSSAGPSAHASPGNGHDKQDDREWIADDDGPTPEEPEGFYNARGEPASKGNGREQKSAPTFKNIINPADWEGVPVPERKWCVRDYFPHGQVCLLSGDGGQGKSLLALQLAVARQMGCDWIGLLPEPGKTLILSAEDDAEELHRRFDDVRKFYGATWPELAGIRLIDLVGEDSILARLLKGCIEPTEMYAALDAYMSEFCPSLVILDVLADMFAGDESDRPQVRQFINLLKRLARKHDCTILLLAHPSLTGMNSGTGLSGSTDWNNAVRARAYLKTPKTADGETPDKNLRVFEGMKANYGEVGGKITLRWQDGVFVRVESSTGMDKMAADQKADDVFMSLVARFQHEGRNVSPNPGSTYAPTVFEKEDDAAGMKKQVLAKAMSRLLKAAKIKNEKFGSKSHERTRLILSEGNDDA